MGSWMQDAALRKVDAALAALADNPKKLERTRRRFTRSTPPYIPTDSSITLSPGPELSDEEQWARRVRKLELVIERRASKPRRQYRNQTEREASRLIQKARNGQGGEEYILGGFLNRRPFERLARAAVKERWIEQGIWKDEWTQSWYGRPTGLWKHEEPLAPDPESEPEPEPELEPTPSPSSPPQQPPEAKVKGPKTDEEMKRKAELRAARERNRKASRPFYQFIYQVTRERELIRDRSGVDGIPAPDPADINTTSYEAVKSTWVQEGVWDSKWGVLPGMSWKHERDLSELIREELGDSPPPKETDAAPETRAPSPQLSSLQSGPPSHELGTPPEALPRVPIGPAVWNGSGAAEEMPPNWDAFTYHPLPAIPESVQEADVSSAAEAEPAPDVAMSVEAPDGDADSPSPPPPSAGRGRRRRRRPQSASPHLSPPRAALGPLQPSKVAKARVLAARLGRPRKPAAAGPPATGAAADPLRQPVPEPRRTRRRLQEAAERAAAAPVDVPPVPPNRIAKPKPKRAGATGANVAGSAKPQGVAKKKAPSKPRGKRAK